MKSWKPETVLIAVTAALAVVAGGYFTGRMTATPDAAAAVITQRVPEPELVQPEAIPASAEAEETPDGPVNLNTADAETLATLPGIGEKLADRIIAYREETGPFTDPAELTEVEGIGEKKLEAILGLVCVGE